ncbi:hypothetical protein TWF694_000998 [Orbilia ellipsospora]|uniref:Uncharacterized protein n=1 Tax=Orbilia ellipsospora TaxID=2528407 RepID=A0AAV9XQI7_9PEZI
MSATGMQTLRDLRSRKRKRNPEPEVPMAPSAKRTRGNGPAQAFFSEVPAAAATLPTFSMQTRSRAAAAARGDKSGSNDPSTAANRPPVAQADAQGLPYSPETIRRRQEVNLDTTYDYMLTVPRRRNRNPPESLSIASSSSATVAGPSAAAPNAVQDTQYAVYRDRRGRPLHGYRLKPVHPDPECPPWRGVVKAFVREREPEEEEEVEDSHVASPEAEVSQANPTTKSGRVSSKQALREPAGTETRQRQGRRVAFDIPSEGANEEGGTVSRRGGESATSTSKRGSIETVVPTVNARARRARHGDEDGSKTSGLQTQTSGARGSCLKKRSRVDFGEPNENVEDAVEGVLETRPAKRPCQPQKKQPLATAVSSGSEVGDKNGGDATCADSITTSGVGTRRQQKLASSESQIPKGRKSSKKNGRRTLELQELGPSTSRTRERKSAVTDKPALEPSRSSQRLKEKKERQQMQ